MNVTELFEIAARLLVERARMLPTTKAEQKAIVEIMHRAKMMRRKLDASRALKAAFEKWAVSRQHLIDELKRALPCVACGAEIGEKPPFDNPLLRCTGAFDCAMQRCRYRSSEWSPPSN